MIKNTVKHYAYALLFVSSFVSAMVSDEIKTYDETLSYVCRDAGIIEYRAYYYCFSDAKKEQCRAVFISFVKEYAQFAWTKDTTATTFDHNDLCNFGNYYAILKDKLVHVMSDFDF